MPISPRDDLTEIKRIPIEQVAARLGIKIRGRTARCPYHRHEDRNPSFQLYPEQNRCWCHRCEDGGTTVDLVALAQGVGVGEAIRWLRAEFGGGGIIRVRAPMTASRMPAPVQRPATSAQRRGSPDIYAALLELCPLDEMGLTYLRGRGFTEETIRHFRLGSLRDPRFVQNNLVRRFGNAAVQEAGLLNDRGSGLVLHNPSILVPFLGGERVEYLQARKLPDGALPKWSGPKGVNKPVFNFSVISAAKSVYICEGAMDVMAAHQLGFSAIGLLGGATPLAEDTIRALRGRSIYIVPDNDTIGETMVKRVKAQLKNAGLSAMVKRVPTGEDLSDFVRISRSRK